MVDRNEKETATIRATGFPQPSFLEGMARVMDVGDTLNQFDESDLYRLLEKIQSQQLEIRTGPEADAEEIRKIWLTVGQYLQDAMGQFEIEEGDNMPLVGKMNE